LGKAEKDWIESIKNGGEAELNSLYALYREEFISWSGSVYKLDEAVAADVFQDAVITFYWNVKKGKLTELTSSVKTYLFAIGKNLSLKRIKKDSKMVVDSQVLEYNASFEFDEVNLEVTERQQVIAALLKNLGDPCKSILKMFYFDSFTMDSIAERLGYKNENVVKTQKLRCLQKLKAMFEQKSMSEDDV